MPWSTIYFCAKAGCVILIIYGVVKAANTIIRAIEQMPGVSRMRDRWNGEDEK